MNNKYMNNKKECYQYIQNQPKVSASGKPYTLEPLKTRNWEGVL